MGNMILAAAKSSNSGSYVFLLAIVVLFGLLYFITIRPQRNRQRQIMQTQREVGVGARVRTTAGMYATVVAVDGDDVILEIAPGVQARFLRRAIMEVLGDTGTPADEEAGAEPEASEEAGDASFDGASGHATMAGDGAAGDAAKPGPAGKAQAEKEQPAG